MINPPFNARVRTWSRSKTHITCMVCTYVRIGLRTRDGVHIYILIIKLYILAVWNAKHHCLMYMHLRTYVLAGQTKQNKTNKSTFSSAYLGTYSCFIYFVINASPWRWEQICVVSDSYLCCIIYSHHSYILTEQLMFQTGAAASIYTLNMQYIVFSVSIYWEITQRIIWVSFPLRLLQMATTGFPLRY